MSEDISFIAPDGGDPVDYFERTAYKVGDADPKALIDAAIFLEDRIRVRTANGESFRGGRFTAYNDDYIIQKEKAGLESDIVNLRFHGAMMASMSTRLGASKSFEIGFFDNARQAEKARINNEGAYFALVHNRERGEKIRERFDPVRHAHLTKGFVVIPDRPFLGFTQEDLDLAAEIIAGHISDDNPYGFTKEEMLLDQEDSSYESDASFYHRTSRKKRRRSVDY